MNRLRDSRSIFSQIRRRHHHHPTFPRRRLIDLFSSVREFITTPRVRPPVRPSSTVSPLHRQYGTKAPRRFVLRWYHEPRKVAAATAITLNAMVMAACSRCDREIVPCTYRSHLVRYSQQEERDIGDSVLAELIANYEILDPSDPRSARVRLIAERIVHAVHGGLGIYDSNDAPMLRVTQKRSQKWRGKARPNTSHFPRQNWEVILMNDDNPNAGIVSSGKIFVTTGLFHYFRTDEEIAAIIAHEVGHVIARHSADINNSTYLYEMFFSRRNEIEADYIGILILGVAGFHPQWLHVFMEKAAKLEKGSLCRPSPKKRLQLLSEARIMNEALELYREVIAMDKVTDRYFK
ncbi:unnamed protein product [Alopecurus aequalis]